MFVKKTPELLTGSGPESNVSATNKIQSSTLLTCLRGAVLLQTGSSGQGSECCTENSQNSLNLISKVSQRKTTSEPVSTSIDIPALSDLELERLDQITAVI